MVSAELGAMASGGVPIRRKLAVIGAGAKAAALVARAAVLSDLGVLDVPEIYVFDRNGVGSAWSGDQGFSSGHLTLCSPAEKDVGFPYLEAMPTIAGHSIARALFGRFSWQAFLVADGRYAEWVDRGRDYPIHRLWADYLAWVFVEADHPVSIADVTEVENRLPGKWRITATDATGQYYVDVDGVVLTGTGDAFTLKTDGTAVPADHLLDAETFWEARERVVTMKNIAVAGAGGGAGTIIGWLSRRLAGENATIYSISPMGTLLPRGDGFSERRWFTDPSDWGELSADHRRKILDHTESGVISMRNKGTIDLATNIAYVRGKADRVAWDGAEMRIDIVYDKGSSGAPRLVAEPPLLVDCLINAIGFNPWSLLKIVKGRLAQTLWQADAKTRETVADAMLRNLSFDASAGLGHNLHVPVLAAFALGPGYSTLGCLGSMAQSILDSYLSSPPSLCAPTA